MSKLPAELIQSTLDETVGSFPHPACQTCECFLGLVAQLHSLADANGKEILKTYKVQSKEIHACLGCDPCPPGDRYADYISSR
jgi:hypothetical protein